MSHGLKLKVTFCCNPGCIYTNVWCVCVGDVQYFIGGCLPVTIDGGNQLLLQVIKRLGCLSYTQGPMVHPDATVHQTLLLRYQLMTFQPAEDLWLQPYHVMFRLEPLPEHALSDKLLFAFAHSLRSGATTRDKIQGLLVASIVLSFQEDLLNIFAWLRMARLLLNIPADPADVGRHWSACSPSSRALEQSCSTRACSSTTSLYQLKDGEGSRACPFCGSLGGGPSGSFRRH